MNWHVYIVKCSDGSFYTGVAKDLEARIAQHNAGEGAKYTRARRPVRVVYSERAEDRSSAQLRVYALKQLSRAEKAALILESRAGTDR